MNEISLRKFGPSVTEEGLILYDRDRLPDDYSPGPARHLCVPASEIADRLEQAAATLAELDDTGGVAKAHQVRASALARLGRIGGKTPGLYLTTTAIAISLAITVAVIVQPGVGGEFETAGAATDNHDAFWRDGIHAHRQSRA